MGTCEIKGKWLVKLYGPDGIIKDCKEGFNVITTNGKEALADLLDNCATAAATNTFRYVGIGSDSTAEAAANTALGTELARHTGTVTYISGAIYQVEATFPAGTGTGAVVEYGLFNSNTNGTMLSRDTESVINKGAGDSLEATVQITIS